MIYAMIGISENWRHEPVSYFDTREEAENIGWIDSVHDWTHEDIIEIQNTSTAEPISDINIKIGDKTIFASYWGAVEHKNDNSEIFYCHGYLELDGKIEMYYDGSPYPYKDSNYYDLDFIATEEGIILKHNYENEKNEIKKLVVEEFLNKYIDEIIIKLLTAPIWCDNDNEDRERRRKQLLKHLNKMD